MGTLLPIRQQQVGVSPIRGSFEEISNVINHNQLQFHPQSTKNGVGVTILPSGNQAQLITTTPQVSSKKGSSGAQ